MGFEQAGWECVYSIEWDKHKRKIYEVIFGNEPEGSDIRAIRNNDIPRADCWTFGAPCQDFSIAGTRSGLEGDRSSLIREVFRLVRETEEEHRPEWLLYENVKGMLSSNKGLDYLEILFEMESLGYDISWQVLNSKDFGVPQNRERVFTLGHLRTRGSRKIFPIFGQGNTNTTVGKSTETTVARTFTAGGHSGGNHSGMTIIEIAKMYPDRHSSLANSILSIEGVSPTLDAMQGGNRQPKIEVKACLMPNSKTSCNQATLTQGKIRRLTPRECMRLQGVADYITDKMITAKISDSQMYRAAGDACTVNVLFEIAKKIKQ